MRPRLIAVEDELAEMVIGNTWTLQGGHGGSPWMTWNTDLFAIDRLSFNEATADRRGGPVKSPVRPKSSPMLQGGHGGSPWMTERDAASELLFAQLQGGHGGSPWMTLHRWAQCKEQCELQGGHGGSPWMTRRVADRQHGQREASMRPRLIAVDDTHRSILGSMSGCGFNEATADRRGGRRRGCDFAREELAASMRPRLIAVDDFLRIAQVAAEGGSFNEATADRRGGPNKEGEAALGIVASMRPRLIAVDDFSPRSSTSTSFALQGGHGGPPWMTRSGAVPHALERRRASMRPRLIAVDDAIRIARRQENIALQGGHGGSPWMTGAAPRDRREIMEASMRPRLIAVDDMRSAVSRLTRQSSFNEATADRRGGHAFSSLSPHQAIKLQGGHGGSPWMTVLAPPHRLLGVGASMRPRLIAVDDFSAHAPVSDRGGGFNEATADRRGGPRSRRTDHPLPRCRFNEATADRRGGRCRAGPSAQGRPRFNEATADRRGGLVSP